MLPVPFDERTITIQRTLKKLRRDLKLYAEVRLMELSHYTEPAWALEAAIDQLLADGDAYIEWPMLKRIWRPIKPRKEQNP